MSAQVEVPDIGDFEDVEVIEVVVAPGDVVEADDPLIVLESDKASMEVPAPRAGKIEDVLVSVGDRVSKGTPIVRMQGAADSSGHDARRSREEPASPPASAATPASGENAGADRAFDLVVLGAGPGGYSAAFRAADLGMKVALVDRWETLGGVCLNVGCIPSKALLHAAKVLSEVEDMEAHGLSFASIEIDLDRLRDWKDGVVRKLTDGLAAMAKMRKVEVVRGVGAFTGPNTLEVTKPDGDKERLGFGQAIVAAGSEPVTLPFVPHDDPRVIDSTGALELDGAPERLLVLGGGIIGLEMATVYHELGSRVSIVELMDQLIPGADPDIVKPLHKRIAERYENIWLGSKVTGVEAREDALHVSFEGGSAPAEMAFDKVLVAVGRKPNGKRIGAEAAGIEIDDRGFVSVDKQMRTNVPHIFAIGDIVGQPMLAHKAVHEGKVAAEVAAGKKSAFDAKVIPSVAYTDPEVAWVGLTETEAKKNGVAYEKGVFPWAASGRSLALGRDEGITKILFDPETERLIGAGVVGANAGDLISEAGLAIEMGADARDVALTVHPHPTLSETVAMATEMFEGSITDLIPPKRKKRN